MKLFKFTLFSITISFVFLPNIFAQDLEHSKRWSDNHRQGHPFTAREQSKFGTPRNRKYSQNIPHPLRPGEIFGPHNIPTHPVVPNVQQIRPNIPPDIQPMGGPNIHLINPNIQPIAPNVRPFNPNIQPIGPNIRPINPNNYNYPGQ